MGFVEGHKKFSFDFSFDHYPKCEKLWLVVGLEPCGPLAKEQCLMDRPQAFVVVGSASTHHRPVAAAASGTAANVGRLVFLHRFVNVAVVVRLHRLGLFKRDVAKQVRSGHK